LDRQTIFVYSGRPLSEVIEDVQRYVTVRISIDPVVAQLKYSGFVLQGNVEQWIRGLPEVFPGLTVETDATGITIRILQRPPTFGVQSTRR
jgi:ferric-dicitrate binding protein FerR (iron transport regulator)